MASHLRAAVRKNVASAFAHPTGEEIADLRAGGVMLKFAAIFLLVGLVAALLGFTAIAGASFAVAKVLAGIFLFMFLLVLVFALFSTRTA